MSEAKTNRTLDPANHDEYGRGAPKEPVTSCILRRFKGADGGDLVACFPYPRSERRPRTDGTCYQRVGQHGEYDAEAIRSRTVPVSETERTTAPDAVALVRELERIGYRLAFKSRGLS